MHDDDSYRQTRTKRMINLSGLRVLVVEDEGAVALLIEDMLVELGCVIAASAAHLSKANEVARSAAIDLAVLDVNLDGQLVFPAAHTLRERGIPFVFSTGYGAGGIPTDLVGYPVLAKPFEINSLREAVVTAIARKAIPRSAVALTSSTKLSSKAD